MACGGVVVRRDLHPGPGPGPRLLHRLEPGEGRARLRRTDLHRRRSAAPTDRRRARQAGDEDDDGRTNWLTASSFCCCWWYGGVAGVVVMTLCHTWFTAPGVVLRELYVVRTTPPPLPPWPADWLAWALPPSCRVGWLSHAASLLVVVALCALVAGGYRDLRGGRRAHHDRLHAHHQVRRKTSSLPPSLCLTCVCLCLVCRLSSACSS